MGTSKSYDGPGDKNPLLPAWAQGPPVAPAPCLPIGPTQSPLNPLPSQPDQPRPSSFPDSGGIATPGSTPSPTGSPRPQLTAPSGSWISAKRRMTSFAIKGGSGRLQTAARRYVRARGGSKRAAASSSSGQRSTASLGAFLADVVNRGVEQAATAIGVGNLLGQPVETVLAAILNAIAPEGATADDVTARRADADALAALFDELKVQDGGVAKLNSMDAVSVASAIQASVASYIYHRWLLDLGKRLEERAVTPKHAVKLERDVKQHVKNLVKINLSGKDVLRVDWRGSEGRQFTQQIYEEAYELLGNSQ